MNWKASRREFIAGLTALAGSWAIPAAAFPPFEPLYPPMDLSDFDTPISGAPAEIKVGYAAITWGGNDQRAIEDIAALGFSGIQLRSNLLGERSEEHTSELQSPCNLVCRLLLEKKKKHRASTNLSVQIWRNYYISSHPVLFDDLLLLDHDLLF